MTFHDSGHDDCLDDCFHVVVLACLFVCWVDVCCFLQFLLLKSSIGACVRSFACGRLRAVVCFLVVLFSCFVLLFCFLVVCVRSFVVVHIVVLSFAF